MPFSNPTVVCPIDFSKESAFAIQSALSVAGSPARMHVVHVIPPLDPLSPGALMDTVTDATRRQYVQTNMEKLLRENKATGAVETVLIGDPGMQISEYASKIKADLIVIPSHGYHGIKRLLIGSVAERVIRHAHCSVLVLRRSDAE